MEIRIKLSSITAKNTIYCVIYLKTSQNSKFVQLIKTFLTTVNSILNFIKNFN